MPSAPAAASPGGSPHSTSCPPQSPLPPCPLYVAALRQLPTGPPPREPFPRSCAFLRGSKTSGSEWPAGRTCPAVCVKRRLRSPGHARRRVVHLGGGGGRCSRCVYTPGRRGRGICTLRRRCVVPGPAGAPSRCVTVVCNEGIAKCKRGWAPGFRCGFWLAGAPAAGRLSIGEHGTSYVRILGHDR